MTDYVIINNHTISVMTNNGLKTLNRYNTIDFESLLKALKEDNTQKIEKYLYDRPLEYYALIKQNSEGVLQKWSELNEITPNFIGYFSSKESAMYAYPELFI